MSVVSLRYTTRDVLNFPHRIDKKKRLSKFEVKLKEKYIL